MILPACLTSMRGYAPSRGAARRLAIGMMMAALATAAYGGSPPDSYSNMPGYFLGSSAWGAYLGPEHPKQYIDEIRTVCERKGQVWALGVQSPFKCINFSGPGEGDYALQISPKKPPGVSNPEKIRLFSVRPFPTYEWKSRTANDAEVSGVAALFKNDRSKLGAIQRAFASRKTMIFDSPDKNTTTFVMFWKTVFDGPLDESNPVYLVAIEKNGQFSKAGEIEGAIVGVVDLDGDGIPEFHMSMDCDGTCESVISLNKKIGIGIAVH